MPIVFDRLSSFDHADFSGCRVTPRNSKNGLRFLQSANLSNLPCQIAAKGALYPPTFRRFQPRTKRLCRQLPVSLAGGFGPSGFWPWLLHRRYPFVWLN